MNIMPKVVKESQDAQIDRQSSPIDLKEILGEKIRRAKEYNMNEKRGRIVRYLKCPLCGKTTPLKSLVIPDEEGLFIIQERKAAGRRGFPVVAEYDVTDSTENHGALILAFAERVQFLYDTLVELHYLPDKTITAELEARQAEAGNRKTEAEEEGVWGFLAELIKDTKPKATLTVQDFLTILNFMQGKKRQ